MNKATMMKKSALLLLCAGLAACASASDPPTAAAPPNEPAEKTPTDKKDGFHTEKPAAPVGIEAKLDGAHAALSLVFEADAADVNVKVWGVDGLAVTSDASPIKGRAFAKGETITIDVAFTAPQNRADLAVEVQGTFGGKTRGIVRSFTVNASAPPLKSPAGEVRTGPDGKPVRVMKPE